ncbi:MAG: protein kinase domain-containing protein [Solirubrobacteraceae bacterium]
MTFDSSQPAYLALRDIVAERTRPLLVWSGAGISAEAGLPTWPELKSALIEGLRAKADDLGGVSKKLRSAADLAESEENYWTAFEILHEHLGRTDFRDYINRPFNDAYRLETPSAYAPLWNLGIEGMVTLNLDRFAIRSLFDHRPGETHLERNGDAVGRLRRHLHTARPFVANLHGIIDDDATWVFTRSQLAALFKGDAYRGFVEICLSTYTVLFVGISVADIAIGGHLDRLRGLKIDNPTHFWLTHVRELNVDRWCGEVGVKPIRYEAEDGDHSQLLQLLENLRSHVSEDAADPPRVHLSAPLEALASLPPESELLTLPPEQIRRALNGHAQRLLASESEDAEAQYDEFAARYDQALYQAWYTSTQAGKNELLDYVLLESARRGAFGLVYRACGADGKQVAVKILLDEVRQNSDSLRAFRRGVRSMRILSERKVTGMVPYLEASEIPAFVVMDWIEGPNLAEARQAGVIADWYAVLDIALQITRTIRRAHALPERVLHRDIRPANVMLQDFWVDQERRDVVVLDFDLSWHLGSNERSIVHTSANGYLAPEQLRPGTASTRSALVDSFGLAMTIFYLCGGQDPVPEQHLHERWPDDVRRACAVLPSVEWRSLPTRVERLIRAGAHGAQTARWGMAEIEHELELLQSALHAPASIQSADLLAEELAARSYSLRDYVWNADRAEAVREAATGLRVAVGANLNKDDLVATVSYVDDGRRHRATLGKYVGDAASSLAEQMKAAGWRITSREASYADFSVIGRIEPRTAVHQVDRLARALDNAVGRLKFEH